MTPPQTPSAPQMRRLPRSPALIFIRAGNYQGTIKYTAEVDASAQVYKARLRALIRVGLRLGNRPTRYGRRGLRFNWKTTTKLPKPSRTVTTPASPRPVDAEWDFAIYEDPVTPVKSPRGGPAWNRR